MSGDPAIYFTATHLAAFCGVDLKTIHNWANKGKVPHFRTPGRHLRFKPLDVKAFLEAFGYDVPSAVIEAQPASVAA